MSTTDDASVVHAGLGARWARAALLAAVVLGTGTLAHSSAGGLLPGPTAFVVLSGVVVLGCAALLGRPASTTRIVLMVLAGQTFVHGTLTALSGHRGDPPLRTTAPSAPVLLPHAATGGASGQRRGSYYELAYSGGAPSSGGQVNVPAPVQHLMADLSGPHAAMALAHLVAAGLVGLWLAHGERTLWALVGLLRHALCRLFTTASTPLLPARVRAGRTAPTRPPAHLLLLSVTCSWRGPPVLLQDS